VSDEETNRVTDPISNQDEADGLRASLAERKAIPPAELTPVQEEAIALDEARLAQWDAGGGRHNVSEEADL
jgi:hypothetical protein